MNSIMDAEVFGMYHSEGQKMIKRITIHNFKSLRHVELNLEPVTVLIGRSGTGKTNLIYALRFLRDYLEKGDIGCVNWPVSFCATAQDEKLAIGVDFNVPGFEGEFTYVISFRYKASSQPSLIDEKLALGNCILFHQSNGKWESEPRLVNPPQPGHSVLRLLYGMQEAKVAHLALTKGIGCYDFPGDVLIKGAYKPAEGTSLDDSADNYLTSLDAIVNNLSELDSVKDMIAALQRLNTSIATIELAVDRSHILVSHQVSGEKVLSFKLPQESEGLRRFLAHLIALHQLPTKQVLAFEEPEKGIYPGALAVLAEYFQAVADSGRSQVILTTHSPELLKHFKHNHIRVVEMEGYETKIGPLAPEQRESLEEHLMTTDELLTVDEARLEDPTTQTSQS